MATTTIAGEQARHLRWVGGAMIGAALVMNRLPAGVGLPCPLRSLTGVPCPLCGMQTSVKAAVVGDLWGAAVANPVGVVAVVVAVILLVTRPESIRLPPPPMVVSALAAMWVFQLGRFGLMPGFG